jgi:hypothetical protein
LLVAILIGSIIVTVLLQLVLELLQIERRETALDMTQRDMRRALEYISSDVREAIYVYSSPADFEGLKKLHEAGALPAASTTDTVLAFWRLNPVEDVSDLDCDSMSGDKQDECNVLKVRQSTYSLVVYQLLRHDQADPNDIWDGESRIVRYELPKYSNISNLTQTPGFVEPVSRTNPESSFGNWEPTATVESGSGWHAVLVDYVDAPNNLDGVENQDILTCPSGMLRSPANSTAYTSFFSCIQDPTADEGNLNQDVEIFLRGNFEAANGSSLVRALSESSALPTLQTGVLVRGVLDKNL